MSREMQITWVRRRHCIRRPRCVWARWIATSVSCLAIECACCTSGHQLQSEASLLCWQVRAGSQGRVESAEVYMHQRHRRGTFFHFRSGFISCNCWTTQSETLLELSHKASVVVLFFVFLFVFFTLVDCWKYECESKTVFELEPKVLFSVWFLITYWKYHCELQSFSLFCWGGGLFFVKYNLKPWTQTYFVWEFHLILCNRWLKELLRVK